MYKSGPESSGSFYLSLPEVAECRVEGRVCRLPLVKVKESDSKRNPNTVTRLEGGSSVDTRGFRDKDGDGTIWRESFGEEKTVSYIARQPFQIVAHVFKDCGFLVSYGEINFKTVYQAGRLVSAAVDVLSLANNGVSSHSSLNKDDVDRVSKLVERGCQLVMGFSSNVDIPEMRLVEVSTEDVEPKIVSIIDLEVTPNVYVDDSGNEVECLVATFRPEGFTARAAIMAIKDRVMIGWLPDDGILKALFFNNMIDQEVFEGCFRNSEASSLAVRQLLFKIMGTDLGFF